VFPGPPAFTVQPAHVARRRANPKRVSKAQAPEPVEIATKFYALPDADMLAPIEDASVMRVELPRSAMRLVGLPVNQERAAERIRADVVVGQDGVARLVRFIQ
jgi:hypothetical protein